MLLKPESDQKHVSNMCACTCFAFQMFFSSLLNVLTIIGAVYCMLVSLQALYEGPLICNSQGNSTTSCEFSFEKLSDFDPESFDLHWFLNDSCILSTSTNYSTINNDTRASGWGDLDFDVDFSSKQSRYKTVHLAVFLGLLLVGILELLFGLSQIIIGFLGCLCGVSKRRGHVV